MKGIRKFSPIFFILLDCVCRERDTLCVFGMPCQCLSGGLWPISHGGAGFFPSSALSLLVASEKKRKWALGRVQKNSLYITSFSLDGSGKHLSIRVV